MMRQHQEEGSPAGRQQGTRALPCALPASWAAAAAAPRSSTLLSVLSKAARTQHWSFQYWTFQFVALQMSGG